MMDNFTQTVQRLPMAVVKEYSKRNNFIGVTPFKAQVNFDIPLFEGQIDVDSLEKCLNMLEGYYFVQKCFESEKITFVLLKSLPHVISWWEGYWERYTMSESTHFGREANSATFVESLKEELYLVGNYDDEYMKWMSLHQKRDQTVSEYTNIFHTLRSKLGIKDSQWHLVLKYHSGMHMYIQTMMDFLEISH
jgi:hypothetical protein